jgi:hypothetical protein
MSSKVSGVRVEDWVKSTTRFVEAQAAKAANRDGVIYPVSAPVLSKTLQDNFARSGFAKADGSVKAADFAREVTVNVTAWARASAGGDGFLTASEGARLPKDLRDNFFAYLHSQQRGSVTAGQWTTRDATTKARIAEHLKAFGASPVSYEQARAKAIIAVATEQYALPWFAAEFGGDDGGRLDDPKAIAAEVKRLLEQGEIELMPADGDIPTGETCKDAWIFSVRTDGQGDHGLWAIVDRESGSTDVSSYN